MSTLSSVLLLPLWLWVLSILLGAGILTVGAVLLAIQIRRNKENDKPPFIIGGIEDDGNNPD